MRVRRPATFYCAHGTGVRHTRAETLAAAKGNGGGFPQRTQARLQDLWIKHRDWVFEPLYYSSLDALVGALDEKIIEPAKIRFAELLARKAEKMKGDYV